jgi:GxxExxY protein
MPALRTGINADPKVEEVAHQVVDAAFAVHKALGPGLLESAYEHCLAFELAERQVTFERQVSLPIMYKGVRVDAGYRLDLLVESCIVVETKAVEELLPIHRAQLLTYLRLSACRIGFLINFNTQLLKTGLRRVIL